jgi:hypothetical protein
MTYPQSFLQKQLYTNLLCFYCYCFYCYCFYCYCFYCYCFYCYCFYCYCFYCYRNRLGVLRDPLTGSLDKVQMETGGLWLSACAMLG